MGRYVKMVKFVHGVGNVKVKNYEMVSGEYDHIQEGVKV